MMRLVNRGCVTFSVNSSVIVFMVVALACTHFLAKPLVKRGFYCDDESLGHPFRENTVPTSVLLAVSILGPILVIILLDRVFKAASRGGKPVTTTSRNLLHFAFGFLFTLLLTDLTKYTCGRLRPNFFAMCGLNFTLVDCGSMSNPSFVTNYTCPGLVGRHWTATNAHLSFVSGHASIACSSAVFVILYIQAKGAGPMQRILPGNLLLPLIQIIVASLAIFTALSRVSDYWHHPSDVLAGSVLGVITQYLNCYYVMRLFDSSGSTSRRGGGGEGNDSKIEDKDQHLRHIHRRLSEETASIHTNRSSINDLSVTKTEAEQNPSH